MPPLPGLHCRHRQNFPGGRTDGEPRGGGEEVETDTRSECGILNQHIEDSTECGILNQHIEDSTECGILNQHIEDSTGPSSFGFQGRGFEFQIQARTVAHL
jgi:hypothetical protein